MSQRKATTLSLNVLISVEQYLGGFRNVIDDDSSLPGRFKTVSFSKYNRTNDAFLFLLSYWISHERKSHWLKKH